LVRHGIMKFLFFLLCQVYLSAGYIQSFAKPRFCLKNNFNTLEQELCPKKYNFIVNSGNQLQFNYKCLCNNTKIDDDCCNTIDEIKYNTFTIPNYDSKCLTLLKNMSLSWNECVNNYKWQKWMYHETYYYKQPENSIPINQVDYNYISAFDSSNHLLSYYIDLDWKELNKNIRDEKFIHCQLKVNHLYYPNAGCRYKGAAGSFDYCLKENSDERSGLCQKLSIKVDPNYFEKDKKIRDAKNKVLKQKKLLFHGMGLDQSLLAEKTSYTLLNELNIIAPKAVYSKLFINNTYNGVYLLVEHIDDEFTEEHFKDDYNNGKGALYKDVLFNIYQDDYFTKRHIEGKNENGFMFEVATSLLFYTSKEDARYILETYFDVHSLAKVIAFNAVIGQTDDWQTRHNFYWYVREKPKDVKKLVMIPWDYDRMNDISFAVENNAPVRISMPKWWTTFPTYFKDNRCIYKLYPIIPIVCDLLSSVMVEGGMKELVNTYIDKFAFTHIKPSYINYLWDNWTKTIEPDLTDDPTASDRFIRQKARNYLFGHILKHRRQRIPTFNSKPSNP